MVNLCSRDSRDPPLWVDTGRNWQLVDQPWSYRIHRLADWLRSIRLAEDLEENRQTSHTAMESFDHKQTGLRPGKPKGYFLRMG